MDYPTLSTVSTSAYFEEGWCERVFTFGAVLNPTVVARRDLGLSNLMTIARFPGKHDLVLLDASVREVTCAMMHNWLDAFMH